MSTANILLMGLIVANIAALVVETMPGMVRFARFFWWFEAASVAVFSVEYVLQSVGRA